MSGLQIQAANMIRFDESVRTFNQNKEQYTRCYLVEMLLFLTTKSQLTRNLAISISWFAAIDMSSGEAKPCCVVSCKPQICNGASRAVTCWRRRADEGKIISFDYTPIR